MFWNNKKFGNSLYNFVDKIEKYESQMKLLPVDFQKPWWDIIWKHRILTFLVMFTEVLTSVFDALLPVIVGYTIQNLNSGLFVIAVVSRLALTWVLNIMFHYNTILQMQCMDSVEYAATKYFLTVDPLYHSTKSSGQIVSKVTRGASSYENILDIITFELLPFLAGFVSVVVTMFVYSFELGLVSTAFIFAITLFNIFGHIILTKVFKPKEIEAQDKLLGISLESLQQAMFIRTSFATTEQLVKFKKSMLDRMVKAGNSWQSGTYINVISRTIYLISFLTIGLTLFSKLNNGLLTPVVCTGIILSYISGTSRVLYIGSGVKRLTKSIAGVTDLFDFIRGFGKQTYPVLEGDNI
jgi:ABC-type multidrug transport system fused ATPase/permease subunit